MLYRKIALVRAVMERTSAIMYVYCQSSKERTAVTTASCIQPLSVDAEQMNGVFTSAVICLQSAFRRATVARTSVEGRHHLNDSVYSGLHLRATNVKRVGMCVNRI